MNGTTKKAMSLLVLGLAVFGLTMTAVSVAAQPADALESEGHALVGLCGGTSDGGGMIGPCWDIAEHGIT